MREQIEQEVHRLHRFFEQWFVGALEEDDGVFAEVADALAPDFVLISPSGEAIQREDLLPRLRSMHAVRRNSPDEFRIWIESFETRFQSGPLHGVTYEECQRSGDEVTRRVSTGVFRERSDTPFGVEWVHVHETWLK